MRAKQDVIDFLILNGFIQEKFNICSNDSCDVIINEDSYQIYDKKEMTTMESTSLNIYWLIGALTYFNYMNKNYKLIGE